MNSGDHVNHMFSTATKVRGGEQGGSLLTQGWEVNVHVLNTHLHWNCQLCLKNKYLKTKMVEVSLNCTSLTTFILFDYSQAIEQVMQQPSS